MLLCWHFVLHTDSKTKKHIDSMSKKQYESNLGYVCALYWPHYKNTSLQTDSSMGFSLSYAWNSNLMLYLTEQLFHMHSHTVCRIISFRNFTFLFNWIFSISHTLKKMRICLILWLCVCTHQFLNSEHNMYLVRYCEYVAIWFEYLLQKKKILIFKSPKLVS